MGRRVLVTRPEPGAAATVGRLAELGFQPIMLPLTEIRSVPLDTWPSAAEFDAVAVTSANAVRHAPAGLVTSLSRLTCFTVGAETSAAARQAGFTAMVEGPGGADALSGRILGTLPQGTRVLYLCGKVRLDRFEGMLAEGGMLVTAVETYDTAPVEVTEASVMEITGGEPVDAALLYSANAASSFSALAARDALKRYLAGAACFCLSPRIADSLNGIDKKRIHVTIRPEEAELLALLSRECGNTP
jgi:uroporphyrinogen-III synthase